MKTLSKILLTATFFIVVFSVNGQTWSPSGSNLYANPTGTNVGIGTSAPNSKLHLNASSGQTGLRVQIAGSSKFTVASNGGVSIGANNDAPPANGLYVYKQINVGNTSSGANAQINLSAGWGDWIRFENILNAGYWAFHNNQGHKDFQIYNRKADGTYMWPFSINENGFTEVQTMGIGTSNLPSDSKLVVDGKITCEEIEVKNVSADFVFEANYKLRSLKEVELFIKENGHLPDIAPASETEKGVNLGEFNQTLLQKIEELTLYVIELKKENEELKSEIDLLK